MASIHHFDNGTWLQPEEYAYPNGGQSRKGAARFPDGKIRRIFAGIPDTYFTIPAHTRIRGKYVAGFVMFANGTLEFFSNQTRGR